MYLEVLSVIFNCMEIPNLLKISIYRAFKSKSCKRD